MSIGNRDQALRRIADNYPTIALTLLTPLLRLLSRVRAAFGGDNDKFLIMLVVAVRTTEHPAFAGFVQADLLAGKVPVLPTLGVNSRSIADSLGAPRETIRRKVAELVKTGWLVRCDASVCITAQAYQQLADVREGIEALALRNYEVVGRLLDQRG